MFDYQVSKHPHFENACETFAQSHNLSELAERSGIKVQVLRNKLNPRQPHQLTPKEIWVLTDITEDSTLVDGFLAQIHCQPCIPVNEMAKEKLHSYVMCAMGKLGELASSAISKDRLTSARRAAMMESINSGIRMLSLSALALQARVHGSPAMAGMVDSVNNISTAIGVI